MADDDVKVETCKVKTDRCDMWCAPCLLWYPKDARKCPKCDRGLLLG